MWFLLCGESFCGQQKPTQHSDGFCLSKVRLFQDPTKSISSRKKDLHQKSCRVSFFFDVWYQTSLFCSFYGSFLEKNTSPFPSPQKTRWWFQRFFIFTPIPGKMIQIDYIIFFKRVGEKPPTRKLCRIIKTEKHLLGSFLEKPLNPFPSPKRHEIRVFHQRINLWSRCCEGGELFDAILEQVDFWGFETPKCVKSMWLFPKNRGTVLRNGWWK